MQDLSEVLEEEFIEAIETKRKDSARKFLIVLQNQFELKKDSIEYKNDIREIKSDVRILAETMKVGFETMNARFEAVDRRFEAVDKRFEQVDKRFSFQQWLIGIGFSAILVAMAILKFLYR